ncbi:hypothetical protein M406DRAFT_336902 [Cryphonectria parasitica EP155]|uniref:Anaphase-promoting complex subunit 5 n=1 Tax=Cryphonectria parasitica (strain ATCC 38755 / EP155) TaxID=660469 RepID=A0A9P4Y8D5_CRYP1|nr:uncharacterized protein M406DRAFT_336902 [Cryphonectria parasitica EP155]KAF3768413.1 hypothetical protein M406DRAFT_336902 [Cryphonectria parasitica EP155]
MAPRFLAPKEIGLLILLTIYCEGAVPADQLINILTFLASHSHTIPIKIPSAPQRRFQRAQEDIDLIESITPFETLLQPIPAAVGLPGRRLWDLFLSRLWDLDSLDTLHRFFYGLPAIIATKEQIRRMIEHDDNHEGADLDHTVPLLSNSPLGLFARRAHVEFRRLPFLSASRLWTDFVIYRQPTAAAWARCGSPILGLRPLSSFDAALEAGAPPDWGSWVPDLVYGDVGNTPTPASAWNIDGLIEFQVAQMQRYGVRVPRELQQRFSILLETSRANPRLAYYLRFLEAWRSGDQSTSFEYLHRFFDYTMQNSDREHHQYALLNLAVLQEDFGCHADAMSSILETIAAGRQKQDITCLNFALNFYYNFSLQHPRLVESARARTMSAAGRETLRYLGSKAQEAGMWPTWCTALLAEAKEGLTSGGSIALALENIARSSHIIVRRGLVNMFGTQLSLYVTVWDRVGVGILANMLCDMFLRCHAQNAILDDTLKITCRLAGLLVGAGRYDEGLELLENMDPDCLHIWKSERYRQKLRALVKLRRNLHRGDLDAADLLLRQVLQTRSDDEPDLLFVADSLHFDLLVRRGDFRAAFDTVDRLITEAHERSGRLGADVVLRVRLLLMKAHLFERTGRPHRGFSIAVRAVALSWKAGLPALLWQSVAALAVILNALGDHDGAADLLCAVLPRCLESDFSHLAANMYSSLADAYVGIAGQVGAKTPAARMEYLNKAMDPLRRAFELYVAVEDLQQKLEVTAKMAMIMRVRGEMTAADDLAARYLELRTGGDDGMR